jgi:hypothetical protein
MRRLSTFIFGMVAGGILIYMALNFHLIRANDGMHLVPKVESKLAATYVDVRSFAAADWLAHKDVAMALVRAERGDLLESMAADSLANDIDRLLPPSASQ